MPHPLMKSLGNKPRRGRVRKCPHCGKEKYIIPCKMIYKTSFCSKEHNVLYMKACAFSFPCKICKKKVYTQPAQLKYRARKTCSLECRGELARVRAEERRKKFGYTKHQLDRLARYSPEARDWRVAVFKRDDYTCQICHTRGTYLEADHIQPFAYFPELRFELSNGRTLCRPCHDKTKISAHFRVFFVENFFI